MDQEVTIIRRILDGDTDSFALLVERYQQPVISMIANILADYHGAQDVAQEVFLAAYKKLNSFDPHRSRFSTWLFTIARNRAVNELKKNKRIAQNRKPQPNTTEPKANTELNEIYEELDSALAELPVKQKIAFTLAHFQQLPYEQIARIEAVSVGTVKSRVARAKQKLAEILKQRTGDNL